MARITLRQLLDHAAEHGYGVPAFNINNMAGPRHHGGGQGRDAPVIIQAAAAPAPTPTTSCWPR